MVTKEALFALQNGSDVRGVAIEGVPGETVNLFPEAVNRIAAGYVRFLSERVGKLPRSCALPSVTIRVSRRRR